uniref:Secreted protein n=1 Tax=Panagrellus redivivus TaxID=6233 RepID=A0A7E4V1K2_PANRE
MPLSPIALCFFYRHPGCDRQRPVMPLSPIALCFFYRHPGCDRQRPRAVTTPPFDVPCIAAGKWVVAAVRDAGNCDKKGGDYAAQNVKAQSTENTEASRAQNVEAPSVQNAEE